MFQVRIHGRGGQGVVTAAELLSVAAFIEGRHAQAFPSFGSERTGAPVVAFCRIDDREIRVARADRRAGRADRPGPDAAAPGRRLQRPRPGRLHPDQHRAQLRRARARRARRALPPRAAADRARHRARPRAPRAPAAQRGAARRVRRAQRADLARLGRRGDPREVPRQARRGQRRRRHGRVRARAAPRRRSRPMLEQIEGSQAVAEAVALCRPEVICAYPISPQTHIVEALSDMVRTGELAPCEYVNVESEFAAMSVAIGASATGARAYTATASQGLLYMGEALYNASGLGLPIVMTVANRAIGAPINIWNDHSDSMSQRDSGWIQLYAETNQEALDLHIQAFKLAEELSLPGDGVHGRLHPHARLRARRPADPGAGRRLPAAVRAAPGARPGRAGHDRRDGRPGGVLRGQVPACTPSRCRRSTSIPEIAAEFAAAFGRDSGGLVRSYRADDAETVVVALGSVLGTIEDVVDELRERGRQDRRGRDQVLPALPARRGARGARPARSASWCSRRRSPSASAGSSARTCGSRCRGCPRRSTTSSPASAAARSRSARCAGCSPTRSRTGSSA